MGYRSFVDAMGVEWQAWDIIPRLADRRAAQRRSAADAVDGDRRAVVERRVQSGGRVALSSGLHAGWLCFEAREEKRRLTPIPADWLRCAVGRLEEYLRAAVPAPRVHPTLGLSSLATLHQRMG